MTKNVIQSAWYRPQNDEKNVIHKKNFPLKNDVSMTLYGKKPHKTPKHEPGRKKSFSI